MLEIGGGIPAAFATRLLAGFGADVVRVEGHAEGPPLTDAEEVYLVAGKRRVSGDVNVRALARASDILVEDGAPGRLEALGLPPGELRSAQPSLVIVSITPFGQTGPYRDYKATNIVSFALGGIMSLTGDPGASRSSPVAARRSTSAGCTPSPLPPRPTSARCCRARVTGWTCLCRSAPPACSSCTGPRPRTATS